MTSQISIAANGYNDSLPEVRDLQEEEELRSESYIG